MKFSLLDADIGVAPEDIASSTRLVFYRFTTVQFLIENRVQTRRQKCRFGAR